MEQPALPPPWPPRTGCVCPQIAARRVQPLWTGAVICQPIHSVRAKAKHEGFYGSGTLDALPQYRKWGIMDAWAIKVANKTDWVLQANTHFEAATADAILYRDQLNGKANSSVSTATWGRLRCPTSTPWRSASNKSYGPDQTPWACGPLSWRPTMKQHNQPTWPN